MNEMQIFEFFLTIVGASAAVIIAGTILSVYLLYRSERRTRVPSGSRPFSHPFGPMLHRR